MRGWILNGKTPFKYGREERFLRGIIFCYLNLFLQTYPYRRTGCSLCDEAVVIERACVCSIPRDDMMKDEKSPK